MASEGCLISIIVPVFNVEKYLRKCMDSIINQTYRNIEVICVDDGSTDSSGKILDEYERKDHRIYVIHTSNYGYGAAMNRGLKTAHGKYVSFVESDDFISKDMIEILFETAYKKDAQVVKAGFYEYDDETGDKKRGIFDCEVHVNKKKPPIGELFSTIEYPALLYGYIYIWNGIYLKDFIFDNNIKFTESPGASFQDTGFSYKVMISADRIVLMDYYGYHYRQDNSNSSIHSKEKIFCICDEFCSIWDYLLNKPYEYNSLKYEIAQSQFQRYGENGGRIAYHYKSIFRKRLVDDFEMLNEKGLLKRSIWGKNNWDYLQNEIEKNKNVITYDIFDTLITRKTATPHGIFAIVQNTISNDEKFSDVPSFLKNNFFALRINAEKRAGARYLSEEMQDITLEEIYEVFQHAFGLSKEISLKLMELELKIEMDNTIGIPSVIESLFKQMENNRIVLISDMYMSEKHVRDILLNIDDRFKEIPIYVSSELKKRKSTGDLFLEVMKKEKIEIDRWIHIGDNAISDYEIPKSLGIHTTPVTPKKLLPLEEEVINGYEDDCYLQYMIGTGMNARLYFKFCDSKNELAFSYGTLLIPLIVDGYIRWVINKAIELRIDTLYFIARDGYMLKQMADWWIEKKKLRIKTKYIYGSRLTWRLTSLTENYCDIEELCKRADSSKYVVAEDMADIFHMDKDEFMSFLPHEINRRTFLGRMGKKYIASLLQENSLFKRRVISKEEHNRKLLTMYLSENISNSERYAFVELYGSGYSQRGLANILHVMGYNNEISNFFCHLSAQLDSPKCKFYAYDPSAGIENSIIELFFSAPEGRTVGYKKNVEGSVEPVFDDESQITSDYGLKDIRSGFNTFLECYDDFEISNEIAVLDRLENIIYNSNNVDLIDFIGNMPFGASGRKMDIQKYAPKLSKNDLRRIFMIRMDEDVEFYYSGSNFDYSYKQCDESDKAYINNCYKQRFSEEAYDERSRLYKEQNYFKDILIQYGMMELLNDNKIAVYGAGRLGKSMVEALQKKRVNIVCWVDKRHEQLSIEEPAIAPVETLFSQDFDKVVVAILRADIRKAVKNYLVVNGIPENKIVLPAIGE